MHYYPDRDILTFLWYSFPPGTELESDGSEKINIIERGEFDVDSQCFRNAALRTGELLVRGDVIFNTPEYPLKEYSNPILRIIEKPTSDILTSMNGTIIPQTVIPVPHRLREIVSNLKNDKDRKECGTHISNMDPHRYTEFADGLMIERLRRKSCEVGELFAKSDGSWSQTLYAMLCRAMGGNNNQEQFLTLASKATLKMLDRERYSISHLEALLLGTSGLLEGCYYDDYIHRLREIFGYLQNKYRIIPMRAAEWTKRNLPAGRPVMRLVQIAALIKDEKLNPETIIGCVNAESLYSAFNVSVSDYWTTHFVPDTESNRCPKRIGQRKIDILGINMVAPFKFAYGAHNGRDELKGQAIDLLCDIKGESNTIVSSWTRYNIRCAKAYDTQALIQLTREYCEKKRCTACKIGRQIIKGRY